MDNKSTQRCIGEDVNPQKPSFEDSKMSMKPFSVLVFKTTSQSTLF
jgi:hypothetical protein